MIDLSNIQALQKGYKDGAHTLAKIVHEVEERIEAAGEDRVWITKLDSQALKKRQLELERKKQAFLKGELPLWGIPFAVKDNIDIAGMLTTVGCPAYAYTAGTTATVVQKLIDAGGILVGKTNMDQFAIGLTGARSPYGVPRNPYGKDYIPGGSSSGSAVAVAAGLVTFALGTDTAGSVRVPAGFNNVVGLKPSRGLISNVGMVPTCLSLDCIGVLAADVRTAATVRDIAAGFDPADYFSRSVHLSDEATTAQTIGVLTPSQQEYFGDPDGARVYNDSIERLKKIGYEICFIDFKPFREAAELLYNGPWMAERYIAVGEFVRENRDAVIKPTGDAILAGGNYSAVDGFKSYYRLKELRRIVDAIWETVDVILVPTVPAVFTVKQADADPIGLMQKLSHYTNYVNLLDLCALAVPSGYAKTSGIPIGSTFIAPKFHDSVLDDVCTKFAKLTERRLPPANA